MLPQILSTIGGGLIGNILGGGDRARAEIAQRQAFEEMKKVRPELAQVSFEEFQRQGSYTPQVADALTMGPSAMTDITANPAYGDAALSALRDMQNIGHQGGMTVADQAAANKILSATNSNEAGKRAAIMQDFAQRGQGGSGFALAQQLLNQQESANRANTAQTDIVAQAQERALRALQSAGGLGAQLGAQDFDQKSKVATATDLINRFNTQNRQDVLNQNTERLNYGQRYNQEANQDIANRNVSLANQQKVQNNQYQQQYYDNQLNRAKALSGQSDKISNMYNNNADQTAKMWGEMGQGVGQAFAADKADQRWQGLTDALQGKKANEEEDKWADYMRS